MSNWAAYKEKEIGLPVVKRAKHGIHFDAGKGLVQAEFVGKPCHYFDGKEYKAIDTRPLLRKDGTYGCAHSDVIIHTDGTVQVGDYTQRAALIYPGKVSVDGDRIARPFSGGVQYLYITEDGFRQEIVLEKMPDLRKVSALVDTVSGVLPTKYTASSLSLKDSSTAELSDFVQVDSKSLASVLEAAKFPVVIDPDIVITTGVGGDNRIDSSLATANFGASTQIFTDADRVAKEIIRFDLSSVDAGNTCTGGTLKLVSDIGETEDTYKIYKISDANGDWVEGGGNNTLAASGESCWNAKSANGAGGVTTAWAGSAGLATAGTDYIDTIIATVTAEVADEATLEIPFNADGLTVLQSWFGDATNNGFLMVSTSTSARSFRSKEDATAGKRPVLTVTYTAGGTFIPVNFNAQMGNLTGNMRG